MTTFIKRFSLAVIVGLILGLVTHSVAIGALLFAITFIALWLPIYRRYARDNPKGYWFKRKFIGWGWTPVTWQGWLVILVGLLIAFVGVYIGDKNHVPAIAVAGVVLMIAIIVAFGFWKGEKPRWESGKDIDKYL